MGRSKSYELPQMRQYAKAGHLYARVRFEGRDIFLGRWGSKEARTAYDRLVSDILLKRRPPGSPKAPPAGPDVVPVPELPATVDPPPAPAAISVAPELLDDLTIAEVGDRYLEHCRHRAHSLSSARRSESIGGADAAGSSRFQGVWWG